MNAQTVTIGDLYEEYRELRNQGDTLTEEARGRQAAYETVVTDCLELIVMETYRKVSRTTRKAYLDRAIVSYEASWPLDDVYSTAARTVIQEAAAKLRQVKL